MSIRFSISFAMSLFSTLFNFPLPPKWQTYVDQHAQAIFDANGNLPCWLAAWEAVPKITSNAINLNQAQITIGQAEEIDTKTQANLKQALLQFSPWRKGPFTIFDIAIDTEWHSDWKWSRIAKHLDLHSKRILDVGCGNGYHLWRMLGAGAKQAIGIDPSVLFVVQFLLIQKFIKTLPPAMVLPFKLEDLPKDLETFDVVFSMGVLYHRRSPLHHLSELKAKLSSGGELVLETLVVDGKEGFTLLPKGRYAKMRNVWFIPSVATLEVWLARMGFMDITLLDVNTTRLDEQRQTKWMQFESLVDFLDPSDASKTIEGYPAPKRAVFKAVAP